MMIRDRTKPDLIINMTIEDKEIETAEDTLVIMGVSEETIQIVTAINGRSLETYENILFAKFGYRSFDQLED